MYALITVTLLLAITALVIRLTRVRKINRELSHRYEETTLILESLQDGIIECDTDLIPTRVNKATEKILGIEASNIIKRSIDKSNTTQDLDKLLAQILFAPKNAGESYDVVLPPPLDKKLRIFTLTKTDPKTKAIVGSIKLIRDVSIETVVERHKSDLISIVSHQLLTPLTGVKWILKSLLGGDGGILTEKQAGMVRRGLEANENMIGLVTDILDVTKVEQAQFTYRKEAHDIVAFVREMINSRKEKAETKRVSILEQASIPSLQISFDRERLGIALGNLLDNAIDYSPEGASVVCSIESAPGKVIMRVADKGIGVPESEKQHIFTKFYRAENARKMRTSGTGLGLYLAKHIALDHGGTISFETKEGLGSTFIITLPT